MESKLRSFKKQAKQLVARAGKQAELEKQQLFDRLYRLGLIERDAKPDNILDLALHDILKRRLQSFVVTKGLARTIQQARQMIVHEHIFVSGRKVDAPSYLVLREDEEKIIFAPDSSFLNIDHPERIVKPKEEHLKEVKVKEKAVPKVEKKPIRVTVEKKAAKAAVVNEGAEEAVVA